MRLRDVACERAGIKDLKIHDLRHTAATRMALKTGNVFLVKALTGHKTMEMLNRPGYCGGPGL